MNLCSNTLNGWCTCGFFSGSGEFDNSSSTVRTGLLFFFFCWMVGIFVWVLRGWGIVIIFLLLLILLVFVSIILGCIMIKF